jgi:SAM-dependent methyltransferase
MAFGACYGHGMYSNSRHDRRADANAASADEQAVRDMYERAPYPGLGSGLKDPGIFIDPLKGELVGRTGIRFLDAGCGTGHFLVGVAKARPDWTCSGLDLSQASLDVAFELAKLHGATVTLKRGSYLDPLPFDDKFDVIAAIGTIHHAADPVGALKNLRASLKDDGYLVMHVYGLRLDREKFDIKEMLDIFEPDLNKVDRRFEIYNALIWHRRKHWPRHLLQMPLIDVLMSGKIWLRNLLRRSRKEVWSPPFTDRFKSPTAPWVDHFCHPCERAYEVPEVVELVRKSGFRIERMLGQGREYPQLIPEGWRADYSKLPDEAKWRLSELLAFRGASFRLILRKDSSFSTAN